MPAGLPERWRVLLSGTFSRTEALIFSATSLAMSLGRFTIVRHAFGDETFRTYALWQTVVAAVPELLTFITDSNRLGGYGLPRRANLACLGASVLLMTGLLLARTPAPFVLLAYVLFDLLLFVEIAYRGRGTNWLLHGLRLISLAVTWSQQLELFLPIELISFAAVAPSALRDPHRVEFWSHQGSRTLAASLGVISASRVREWLTTLAAQLVLPGPLYFAYYLCLRGGMSLASTVYNMVRSSPHFDLRRIFTRARKRMKQKIAPALWIGLAGGGIAFGFGALFYVAIMVIESITGQVALFGIKDARWRIFACNVTGAIAGGLGVWLAHHGYPQAVWAVLIATLSVNIHLLLVQGWPFQRPEKDLDAAS